MAVTISDIPLKSDFTKIYFGCKYKIYILKCQSDIRKAHLAG